jgi:hypothetical protein
MRDLASLRANQQRWRDYTAMVEANPLIQTPASFHGWLGDLYSTTQAVGIRRRADHDGRSVSLARLLFRMAEHPKVLSRDRFVRERLAEWREEADGWFDDVVGRGDSLDPAVPRRELQTLKQKVDPIRRYVNKRLAHLDQHRFQAFPTFADLDATLDHLYGLLRRYHLILLGPALSDDVILDPWEVVFRRASVSDGPTTEQSVIREAISEVAHMSPHEKDLLRSLLNASERVEPDGCTPLKRKTGWVGRSRSRGRFVDKVGRTAFGPFTSSQVRVKGFARVRARPYSSGAKSCRPHSDAGATSS